MTVTPLKWGKWPLLLAAALCLGVAVRILDGISDDGAASLAAIILTVAGSVLLGAFIHSQGKDDR